ncbi:unnamed protein product [Sphenostylis stenocarpa]|uniref:Uncharacterized protein n=1 Tax=Sphenostylis stenocarpa TaxID=92480 RepID=A0AA86TAX1_9FABA|nr:unnamed protein product [Sphenostylis stenocarpa]
MKTISGHCLSVKDVSLSKAAKILSKFVSADNGTSHIINAYLHRASASFTELNQIHKELESSQSHKKYKRHRGEIVKPALSLGHVKSIELRKQQTDNGIAALDDEKSTQTIIKCRQELNGSIGLEKKKKYKKGLENALYADEEEKLEQSKNRKSSDMEDKPEYPTASLAKKKIKRKHSGDIEI